MKTRAYTTSTFSSKRRRSARRLKREGQWLASMAARKKSQEAFSYSESIEGSITGGEVPHTLNRQYVEIWADIRLAAHLRQLLSRMAASVQVTKEYERTRRHWAFLVRCRRDPWMASNLIARAKSYLGAAAVVTL